MRRRFPWLGRIHDAFISAIKPEKIFLDGHIFYLDKLDSLGIFRNQSFEELEKCVIKENLRPGDYSIDLGAHIGFHTITMAKIVGEQGKVFAFEPHPETFSILRKNVEANNCKNVILVQKAVSDCSGNASLFLEDEGGNFLGSSLYHLRGGGNNFVSVATTTLDDFFEVEDERELSRISFIKMDIEGFETRALSGMKKLLSKNKKIKLLLEFYPRALAFAGALPEEYFKTLTEFGYAYYDLHGPMGLSRPASSQELMKFYTAENGRMTNLFCVRYH